jgi:hypothetical protein
MGPTWATEYTSVGLVQTQDPCLGSNFLGGLRMSTMSCGQQIDGTHVLNPALPAESGRPSGERPALRQENWSSAVCCADRDPQQGTSSFFDHLNQGVARIQPCGKDALVTIDAQRVMCQKGGHCQAHVSKHAISLLDDQGSQQLHAIAEVATDKVVAVVPRAKSLLHGCVREDYCLASSNTAFLKGSEAEVSLDNRAMDASCMQAAEDHVPACSSAVSDVNGCATILGCPMKTGPCLGDILSRKVEPLIE